MEESFQCLNLSRRNDGKKPDVSEDNIPSHKIRTGYTSLTEGKEGGEHHYVDVRSSHRVAVDAVEKIDKIAGYVNLAEDVLKGDYEQLLDQSKADIAMDEDIFVATEFYRKAANALKQFGVVFILGPPGTGKTTIGRALLRHYAEQGYAPLQMYKWEEWRHVGSGRRQIVFLDGIWGEIRLYEHWTHKWETILSDIPQLTSQRKCLLVFSMYMHIWKEISSRMTVRDYFQQLPVVNLGSAGELAAREKEMMLKKHIAHRKLLLDDRMLGDIIARDTSGPVYPWCCSEYARQLQEMASHQSTLDKVFSSPSLAYVEFFTVLLRQENNWKDLVPLLALIMKGQGQFIGYTEQTLTELAKLNVEQANVSRFPSLSAFLSESLLSEDGRQFPSRDVYVALGLAMYESGWTKLLLKACDSQFLMNRIATHTPPPVPPGLIITPTSPHYSDFLERVSDDLLSGKALQISQHPSLHHQRFLPDLELSLRNKGLLSVALAAGDLVHKMPLLYWSAWTTPSHSSQSHDGGGASGQLSQWCMKLSRRDEEDGRLLRRTFLACCVLGERVDSRRVADMLEDLCQNQLLLNDVISAVSLPTPPEQFVLSKELRKTVEKVSESPPPLFCGKSSAFSAVQSRDCIPPTIVQLVVNPSWGLVLHPRCVRWYTVFRLLSMCDVNELNWQGYSLLHTAAFNGELPVVQFLTERGADITVTSHKGNTPFTKAVERNQVKIAAFFLQVAVATRGRPHRDVLHWLCGERELSELLKAVVMNRQVDMLRLFLAHGVDVKSQRNHLLTLAKAVKDNDDVVHLLKRTKAT